MTACLSADDCLAFMEGGPQRPGADGVHRHLDECDDCRMMMAEAVRATMRLGSDVPRPALRVLADDERVCGRYQIRRFVARGGMGEVYEAFDDVLRQRVALKTLAITASDQMNAAEGLLREVRIARKVVHFNVYRILELGIHRRGGAPAEAIPFLTMDFLDGETLGRRIAGRGRIPPDEVLPIVRGMAAGLGAIHHAGIVHRDFKSENVFLVRSPDGTERPVVMDFGLARAFEGSLVSAFSSGPRLVGTAAYMAPEQLTGQTVTAATDVFALGIVLFEMLTGRLPFSGDSLAAVALSRLQQTAAAPSSVVPEVGRGWDAVVARCLERAPARRFGDVAELLRALDAVGHPQPKRRGRMLSYGRSFGAAAGVVVIGAITTGVLSHHSRTSVSTRSDLTTPAASLDSRMHPTAPHPTTPPIGVLGTLAPISREHRVPDEPSTSTLAISANARRQRATARAMTRSEEPAYASGPKNLRPTARPASAPTTTRILRADAEDPLAPPAARPPHPDDLADPF